MTSIRGYDFPEALLYLVEHQVWARRETDGSVTVGATALGVAQGGDCFAFVPKAVGSSIGFGKALGMIELSKTIVSVRSPVAGEIVAHNAPAVARPALINEQPYGEGWLVRLVPEDWARDAACLLQWPALIPAVEEYMTLNRVE